MALVLTEDLIRNRVELKHDNLEDVKSLALPGTYHEKVVSLGASLRKFTRLKNLDLSRNNISSLQGLENLKLLEKLNLYYNNIETLDELKLLKYNPNLKEVDLRLNPVTRTETDYRLYLIHMLPNLQMLDDRSVRDRERQGALIHYSSSQATEMTHHPSHEEPLARAPNPRVEHVKSMGSGRVLDDDDVELLDLIAKSGGDFSKSRPLTGSNVKEPFVEDYSLVGLKKLSRHADDGPKIPPAKKHAPSDKKHTPSDNEHAPSDNDQLLAEYKRRYPNIPDMMVSESGPQEPRRDPNLEFYDEVDAYSKFKSHGFFTAKPASETEESSTSFVHIERDSYPPRPSRVQLERTRGGETEEALDNSPGHRRSSSVPADRSQHETMDKPASKKFLDSEKQSPNNKLKSKTSDDVSGSSNSRNAALKSETPESRLFLYQILDLVDRYWNGSKSLHKNNKFKGLAYNAIEDYLRSLVHDQQQREIHQLRDEVSQIRQENDRLQRNEELTKSSLEDTVATEAHLKASLQKAFTDVEMLKDKLQSNTQENKHLQQKIQQLEAYGSQSINQTQIDSLQQQNEQMKRDIEKQQFQIKQFKQLQELSAMLQDSHKSLVQTNDHLLKELEESRERHQHEVEQLNWSYNQLKKTMIGTSGHSVKGENNASAVLYDSDS